MFKINVGNKKLSLAESLVLKRNDKDRFGQKRVIVTSDNPSGNETFATKDIFKKYGAGWDSVDKAWYWSDRFKPIEVIMKTANSATREANEFLKAEHKDVEVFNDLEEVVKAKEFLVNLRGALTAIKSKSTIGTGILETYVQELSDKLEDGKLLDDIVNFNKTMMRYKLESGKYIYSPSNMFLIWLQMSRGSREAGSVPYWLGRGYQPKENAIQIHIIRIKAPEVKVNALSIIKKYPNALKEYNIEIGKPANTWLNDSTYYGFWVWAKEKGYNIALPLVFVDGVVYDNLNVEPIKGVNQLDPPETPKWYNDDDTEDSIASVMIDALIRFNKSNGISVTHSPDELGTSRGMSSGGHIKLLTESPTVGTLSVLIHESTHEICHQFSNRELFGGKYFLNDKVNGLSREDKELHADSVAYIVLRSYDFSVEHNVTYLALWKANREKIMKYQKSLVNVSQLFIKAIDDYANELYSNGGSGGEVSSELTEVFISIKGIIKEFKSIFNG